MLQTFINIVHVFVCLVLMGVVLLQQGKGGGMGAAFGGATTQVFGGRGAGNILTRATAICAAIFMLTSVSLAYISSSGDRALKAKAAQEAAHKKDRGQLKERTQEAPKDEAATPSSAPAGTGAPTGTEAPAGTETPTGTDEAPKTGAPDTAPKNREPTTGVPATGEAPPKTPAPTKAAPTPKNDPAPAGEAPKDEAETP